MIEIARLETLRLLLLGSKADASQDELIELLEGYATKRLGLVISLVRGRLGLDPSNAIPEALQFIVDEVLAKRWNRVGSEGFTSESVGGHSVSFSAEDFSEFLPLVSEYLASEQAETLRGSGRVVIY